MHLCEPLDDDQELYGIVFQANQAVQIRLMGEESTILSFNVCHENGNVVISGLHRDYKQVVQWIPVEEGSVRGEDSVRRATVCYSPTEYASKAGVSVARVRSYRHRRERNLVLPRPRKNLTAS